MTFPPFLPGLPGAQIINDFSGLLRPEASNADLDNLFATSVSIYAGAHFWGETLSLVKMKLVDANGGEVDPTNTLALALSDNMPDILHRSMISEVFRGYNLIYKMTNPFSGIPYRLRWMNFNLYTLDKSWDRGLVGFRVWANGTNAKPIQVNYIPLEDGIYWNTIDLRDDFDGVAPAEVAFLYAGIDTEVGTTALSFFQNMAIPALLIQPDKDSKTNPDDTAVQLFTDTLRRIARGALNFGRNVVTPHRWEVKELQAHFDELAMPELINQARESVFLALGVPKEVLLPSAGNYAQAYESRRAWLQTRFKPKAHKVASVLTTQFVHPVEPGWHIEPDFSDVPGMKEDQATLTTTVNQQAAGMLLDLYSAQKALDLDPDPVLKGMYLVRGIPVPKEKLATVWDAEQKKLENSGGIGGNPSAPSIPSATASAPTETQLSPRPAKSDDLYLGDDDYKELRDWQRIIARKGAGYAFEAVHLPETSVIFGRELLANGYEVNEAFSAIKAHVYNARQIDGKKKELIQ